jgi:opacity protein-like surface antigen
MAAVVLTLCTPINAQSAVQRPTQAVVAATGPVFVLPEDTQRPLATLTAGTRVVVGQVQGDWVQVTFPDPALGPRTGWMRRHLLTLSPAPPEQEDRDSRAPARPSAARVAAPVAPRPAARIFGSVAVTRSSAPRSVEAVTGSNKLPAYGGGLQVTNFWHGLFAELSADWSSVDGERVFVFEDEVFRLGIPVEIRATSIDVLGGWRVALGGRVTPYGGAGITFLRYQETSEFADPDENVSERSAGLVAVGGLEVTVVRRLHVGAEVRYRRVENVLGAGGVSAHFGEAAFGGVAGVVRIIVGR